MASAFHGGKLVIDAESAKLVCFFLNGAVVGNRVILCLLTFLLYVSKVVLSCIHDTVKLHPYLDIAMNFPCHYGVI